MSRSTLGSHTPLVRADFSRRSLLRTAAWTTPAVVVAATAPAFAASTGSIIGSQQVARVSAATITSTGSVTNGTPVDQTVRLTWSWTCDDSGAGAGFFTAGETYDAPWVLEDFRYVAAAGNPQRGVLLVVSRPVPAGATVSFPLTNLELSGASVTGGVTAALSAPAPAVVVQPAPLRFPAYVAPAAGQKQKAPAQEARPSQGAHVVILR